MPSWTAGSPRSTEGPPRSRRRSSAGAWGSDVTGFDLQAHRGGHGPHPENTLAAFGHALSLGVTTLELDVHVTADDQVVIAHDRLLGDRLIRHTPAAELGLPRTADVFALLADRGADDVGVNLEVKHDVAAPDEGAPREHFVEVLAEAVAPHAARMQVQAFDWAVLAQVRDAVPGVRLNVLSSPRYLQPGRPGASPWLGGLDVDDHAGSFVTAAASRGFDAISPIHGSPYTAGVTDPDYVAFVTAEMITEAHHAGMRVIPYVVDDPATMRVLVAAGVDGLITNVVEQLRDVVAEVGLPLPRAYP